MVRVVKSTENASRDDTVANIAGNYYDKHGSRNPVVRWLMQQFHGHLVDVVARTQASNVLDVGCGEGHTSEVIRLATGAEVTGIDLEDDIVAEAGERYESITFRTASAYDLPHETDSFDCVVSSEVLEHLEFPDRAVREMRRVSRHWCILSVPNEPWWRIGNMARGAYWTDWGNTPGHVNHWSRRGLVQLLEPSFQEVSAVNAVMWTIASCRK